MASDEWYLAHSPKAIEPDEERWLGPGIMSKRWEDVTRSEVQSLEDGIVRNWACERKASRHDIEARYDCVIGGEYALPDLSAAEEATLWVYMTDKMEGRRIDVALRSAHDDLGKVSVHVNYREGWGYANFCLHNPLKGGVAQRMACGGNYGAANPGHTDAEHVVAGSSRGNLYCQQHRDSHADMTIWACNPWPWPW